MRRQHARVLRARIDHVRQNFNGAGYSMPNKVNNALQVVVGHVAPGGAGGDEKKYLVKIAPARVVGKLAPATDTVNIALVRVDVLVHAYTIPYGTTV